MTKARLVPKEKRDMLEVLAVGTKANVCHVLLTGQLETVYTRGSKCAEFILVGVNFAAKMSFLVSKSFLNSIYRVG